MRLQAFEDIEPPSDETEKGRESLALFKVFTIFSDRRHIRLKRDLNLSLDPINT